MQDKKRIGLIVTLVTVFLCACPGLIAVGLGMVIPASGGTGSNVGSVLAISSICIGVILILIPVAAGIYTWRQSRQSTELGELDVPPPL